MSSTQSPLLWIPCKATEDVQVATAVSSLISSSYGEDPKKYSSSLHSLARARSDAVKGATGSDTTTRDLLFKWFHILEMLEVRFPEVRVPFTWKDAFTGKSISQYSLAYEKAGVIFNTAAVLSSIAAATPRLGGVGGSSGDGTKRAYTALRQAAGFFTYISDNFLHAPSTDMSRALLKWMVPLLLTQANEVFLEKTLVGKSSAGLIAKLAQGVASGYTALAEESKDWRDKDVIDKTWVMLLTAKARHFSSLAHYYKAQADATAGNHGHGLVRLTLAETLSKEAVKLSNGFSACHPASSGPSASAATTFGYSTPAASAYTMPSDAGPSLVALVSSHLALVSEKRAQAVKDNDLIYHDILPSESTLPPIDKTAPAAAISIAEVYATPEVQRVIGPDLFAKLVPLGVHERASLYSEEKAKLARAEAEKCDLAEGERVATLDAMGLPASLEKFRAAVSGKGNWESLVDPPSEVMTWAEEEINGGPARGADPLGPGSRGVQEAFTKIRPLRQAAQQDLQAATTSLDEESRLCEKARVKIGHQFKQDPSGSIPRVKEMRSELRNNRDALKQAEDNDGRIEQRWNEVRQDVELLGRGREAIEGAFAEAVSRTDTSTGAPSATSLLDVSEEDERRSTEDLTQLKRSVEALDAALVKLSKVKRERDTVLSELREKLQTDDIGHLLILNHRGGSNQAAQEAALFRQELEKFRPWLTRLNQAISAQHHLLSEISSLWSTINSSAQGKRITQEWGSKSRGKERLTQRLRAARDGNAEVRAALGKGLQFYEELGQIARGLKASARQWSEERSREREGMEREAEWEGRLGSNGGTGGGAGGLNGLEKSMDGMPAASPYGGGPPPAPLPQRQSSGNYGQAPSGPGPGAYGLPPHQYQQPHSQPPNPYSSPYSSNTSSSSIPSALPPPPPRPDQNRYPYGAQHAPLTTGYPAPPSAQQHQHQYQSAPPPSPSVHQSYGSTSSYGGPGGYTPAPPTAPPRAPYGAYGTPAPAPAPSHTSSGYAGPPPPPAPYGGQASHQHYQGQQGHGQQQQPYPGYAGAPPPPPPSNQQWRGY
ncbi:BRO1-domain-containing protein [Microstroma glucosiphilum]|uniref:BRO domain-containing protein 1 n=1 Tax=Pseudomicrostroma glucosiphilum TaxID=1684307 RepID=A0A316U303_9BASI|nr:BRO1-domain-containing protein [Pseudomicrostroma glucosiphilum]PWN19699.1 BRO1-domain-containing protein [Pseudomicrostroma glucosiphilum]